MVNPKATMMSSLHVHRRLPSRSLALTDQTENLMTRGRTSKTSRLGVDFELRPTPCGLAKETRPR
jgi:hypothetical protein